MQIFINDQKTITEIQSEFNSLFPYLKLEFFARSRKPGGQYIKRAVKNPAMKLGDCRSIHTTGNITLVPEMTVAALVDSFTDTFGLSVEVLRRSGKSWLRTSITNFWTLKEQNLQGEALSGHLGNEAAE